MEAYYSFEDYVEYLYREARRIYPDEPSKQEEYVRSHIPNIYWSWDGTNNYLYFQQQLKRYRELGGYKTVTAGLIILNHLASIIDYAVTNQMRKNGIQGEMSTYVGFTEINLKFNFRF